MESWRQGAAKGRNFEDAPYAEDMNGDSHNIIDRVLYEQREDWDYPVPSHPADVE